MLCGVAGVGQEELFSGEDSADSEPLGTEPPGLREIPLLRFLPGRQGQHSTPSALTQSVSAQYTVLPFTTAYILPLAQYYGCCQFTGLQTTHFNL